MNELKETLRTYILQHPEMSPAQIKEEISRQLKGEIFPGKVEEIYT